jgi:hypothetical protein
MLQNSPPWNTNILDILFFTNPPSIIFNCGLSAYIIKRLLHFETRLLFYLTNICCRFPPLFQHACGWAVEWARLYVINGTPESYKQYYYYYYYYCVIIFSGPAAQRGLWPRSRRFLITHNDAPQSVGLLWTSDQLVAVPDNTHNRPTSISPVGFFFVP